jgi:hypothetical protein
MPAKRRDRVTLVLNLDMRQVKFLKAMLLNEHDCALNLELIRRALRHSVTIIHGRAVNTDDELPNIAMKRRIDFYADHIELKDGCIQCGLRSCTKY